MKSGTKKKAAKRAQSPDAIALLKEDHERVSGLLEKLEKSAKKGGDDQLEIFEQIAEELRVHAQIEEEIFYPAYRAAVEKKEDTKLYFEALEEHDLVVEVIDKARGEDPESEEFAAKGKVLKDLVEHHVEEEEGEMFPRARKALEKADLMALAEEMEARREELMAASPASTASARTGTRRRPSAEPHGRGRQASQSM
jgi:hemerythrin-like domain-containing protein